jgi:DeoR family transcriptional regulator, glycerol-3-phosphate regulon repressor
MSKQHESALTKRHQAILSQVQQKGFSSTEELVKALDVTPQTIRRDINELCAKGYLIRHHGGASLSSSAENVDYKTRQVICLEEKRKIARAVARHIPDKASLFINLGTTTEEVAKALLGHKDLRIITNNLNVAAVLSANPSFEVIITGGVVRNRDLGVIGEATIDFIKNFRVDYAIIGISGVDKDGMLLDFDYREVRVAQAIVDNSRKVYLVTDHTKFGRSAMVRLCHISRIKAMFTDQQPPKELVAIMAESKVALYVADK